MRIWSWRQAVIKSPLASTTKLVLLTLATYMNDHGEACYPTLDTLAGDTSLSRRAVITHIDNAVDSGFLIKELRNIGGREWASNEYRAAFPSDSEGVKDVHPSQSPMDETICRGEPNTPLAVDNTLEGCTSFQKGVNDVHTNSPENILRGGRERGIAAASSAPPIPQQDIGSSSASLIIRCFDDCLAEHTGGMLTRSESIMKAYDHALAFSNAGADVEFCRRIFAGKILERKARNGNIPQGLAYFRHIIPEALAKKPPAKAAFKTVAESATQEETDRNKALAYANWRDLIRNARAVGNHSKAESFAQYLPEQKAHWLASYEKIHGPVDSGVPLVQPRKTEFSGASP